MSTRPALLRVAGLSIDEVSQQAPEAGRLSSSTAQAISLAAGPELLETPSTRAREAVTRYVARMGGRATPFGLLAGSALVSEGNARELELAGRSHDQVFVRLDICVLEAILSSAGCAEQLKSLLQPGREPIDVAAELLEGSGNSRAAEILKAVATTVCGLRSASLVSFDALSRVWRALESRFPALARIPEKNRFHLDLDLSMARATIESGLVGDLDGVLRRLQLLFPSKDPLKAFKAAFRARYEDAEVPLGEVVDFRNGLLETTFSVSSALADEARVERPGKAGRGHEAAEVAVRAFDYWLTTGSSYDIAAHPLASEAVARSVQAALLDPVSSGYRAMFLDGRARAPLALFARFALSRPDRELALRDWIAELDRGAEATPRRLEIVHNVGGHVANVLLRPQFSDEHVMLNGNTTSAARTLSEIGIRLVGDGFVLRDLTSGQPVSVEVNSAHAVDSPGNDAVYRLLAHIAGASRTGWHWGALDGLSHLPRVTCGRIIVTPEQWRVDEANITSVLRSSQPAESLRALLPGLKDRRWVGWGSTDRLLPLDLDRDDLVKAALRRAEGAGRIKFVELPQMEHPAIQGSTGRHVGEVVIPLSRHQPRSTSRAGAHCVVPTWGDDWVYAKYYCGIAGADRVVVAASELARDLRASQVSSQWFFVRYGEDGNHIRVRIRPVGSGHRDSVLSALARLGDRLLADGLISRVVFDRYVPEIARYGGASALKCAEAVFAADSSAIAALLSEGLSDELRLFRAIGDTLAWVGAFYGTDSAAALSALRKGRGGGTAEPRTPGGKYGAFFRDRRSAIDTHLEGHQADSETLRRLSELRDRLPSVADPEALDSVFRAVLHMHFNRLFTLDAPRLERLAGEMAVRKILELRARHR